MNFYANIRFVKENFDNFTCGSSMESLSVSLQNLINALYSRDISRKVSTALLAQQQNGTFQSRNPPYGYMWNEDKSARFKPKAQKRVLKVIRHEEKRSFSSAETFKTLCRHLNSKKRLPLEFYLIYLYLYF